MAPPQVKLRAQTSVKARRGFLELTASGGTMGAPTEAREPTVSMNDRSETSNKKRVVPPPFVGS
ncbi:hypothetical protein GGTG_08987 [Gaeumannomyces tritici R3-111a-1]|uniref:Uncharacterized protein n=1 Tax=Gaeumannomyces tritici (strain R3-111a-1) TaxID=644352 RepID=J3P646_GAET3|nr:hypothetical protein GGTG_08987 [Gaeumannomyces tritici R3-111a-1]EJT72119.1 hypothetical protein GGTG_08987 [Gaeumannomyces tritici R3-111a-1]